MYDDLYKYRCQKCLFVHIVDGFQMKVEYNMTVIKQLTCLISN